MARPRRIEAEAPQSPRKNLSQADVPSYGLQQALKIPRAIADHFGYKPARPIQVAQALGVQPTTGPFRMLCGSAIAYGLTEGGYNAEQIALTPLGKRVVAPTAEGDDARAMCEAFLRPRVVKEFLSRFDNAKLPRDDIAQNILSELGVPRDATQRSLKLILDGLRLLGLLRDINGTQYVDLRGTPTAPSAPAGARDEQSDSAEPIEPNGALLGDSELGTTTTRMPAKTRVFISHGKNVEIVDQIKTMLNVAEVEYEVAVEEETTAIPVSEKVFSAMRNCNSAIICVSPDQREPTADSNESVGRINQNVLIEIGAAFVLYDRRVILLWDKSVDVPSNLQGLYLCRFHGRELSWAEGMRLMEAIKKFKSSP